jgi:hypothetical protein
MRTEITLRTLRPLLCFMHYRQLNRIAVGAYGLVITDYTSLVCRESTGGAFYLFVYTYTVATNVTLKHTACLFHVGKYIIVDSTWAYVLLRSRRQFVKRNFVMRIAIPHRRNVINGFVWV